MEDEFSGALINFAKYGNPSKTPSGNDWPAYTLKHRMTKVFSEKTTVREDFDRELVDYICEHIPSRIRLKKARINDASGY